jgi:hypothetical protein
LKPAAYHEGVALAIDRGGWRYADPAQSAAFIETGYHPIAMRRLPEDTIGRWTVTHGEGVIRARTVRDDELTLDVDAREDMRLTINTPYFPGWTIALDGRDIAATVHVHPESGFMQAAIPAGRHTLAARFVDTPIRRSANIISLASIGSAALYAIWSMRAR